MKKRVLLRCSITAWLLIVTATRISAQTDVDFARRALEDSTFTWRTLGRDGVAIYYQAGSFADRHRAMLLRSVSTAVGEALECLGEEEYERLIRVFYIESREEMNRIVGQPVSGFADWTASSVFIVLNPEWRSFEKHEITHVLTMELWGRPSSSSRWMIEGVAVFCDGWCREYNVDEIAYHLLSHGQLPPLENLFEDFASLGEIRGGFYAASVIGFIRQTYGADALRRLWLNGHDKLTEMLGADVNEVEALWRDHLESTVDKDTHVDLKAILDLGCG